MDLGRSAYYLPKSYINMHSFSQLNTGGRCYICIDELQQLCYSKLRLGLLSALTYSRLQVLLYDLRYEIEDLGKMRRGLNLCMLHLGSIRK